MKELLKFGFTVNTCDNDGVSAISHASKIGNLKMLKELIRLGGDLNIPDEKGYTALHYACEYGETGIVSELIHNENLEFCINNENKTPLYLACEKGHASVVREILFRLGKCVINLKCGSYDKCTALDRAKRSNNTEIVLEITKRIKYLDDIETKRIKHLDDIERFNSRYKYINNPGLFRKMCKLFF